VVDASKLNDVMRMLYNFLTADIGTLEMAMAGTSVSNTVGKYFVKEPPWFEFVSRHAQKLSDPAFVRQVFDLYGLGSGCVCTSTSPIACSKTAYCNMIIYTSLERLMQQQSEEIRIDTLFSPVSSNLDGRPLTEIAFSKADYQMSDDSQPLAAVYCTLYKIVTMNGAKPLRFRANRSSGLPDKYRPHKLVTMRELVEAGWSGNTLEEVELTEAYIRRCLASDYNAPHEVMPNISSATNVGDDGKFPAQALDGITQAEYWTAFHNNYELRKLVDELWLLGQFHLDVAESNSICVATGRVAPASWDELDPADERWKSCAVYELKPHSLFFTHASGGSYSPRSLTDIQADSFSAHQTRIAGEMYDGPLQKNNNLFAGAKSARTKDGDFFMGQAIRLDNGTIVTAALAQVQGINPDQLTGKGLVWTTEVVGALQAQNLMLLFPGISVGTFCSFTHASIIKALAPNLLPSLQTEAEYGLAVTPPGALFMLAPAYKDEYFSCCLGGAFTLARSCGYGRLLLSVSCSATNKAVPNKALDLQGPGPMAADLPTLLCPKVDPLGNEELKFPAGVASNGVEFSYKGKRVSCPFGKLSQIMLIDVLAVYVANVTPDQLGDYFAKFEQHPNLYQVTQFRTALDLNPSAKAKLIDAIGMGVSVMSQTTGDVGIDVSTLQLTSAEILQLNTTLDEWQYTELVPFMHIEQTDGVIS